MKPQLSWISSVALFALLTFLILNPAHIAARPGNELTVAVGDPNPPLTHEDTAISSPEIMVAPTTLSTTQPANTTTQQTVTISNTGTGVLTWTIVEDTALQSPDVFIAPLPVLPENGRWTASMSAFTADSQPDNNLPALALTPCVGGDAGGYPCHNVDLMAFLPLSSIGGGNGNDVWGWTGCNGREFALMGRSSGTAFVEISDPVNPLYLGNLPTHTSTSSWRDIKTYAGYAFIVSEATGHGMQIFDLTQLCSVASPPVTFSNTAHYNGFGDAHNIVINEGSGFAYAVGTNSCSGGLHMVNIQTPTNPTSAGCYSGDGYTHDAQCVIYNGPDLAHIGQEICFNANEDTLTIVDVTDKANPTQLSRTSYSGVGYTHQGWLTENQHYFLLSDEVDERNSGHNTRTLLWNISDLENPSMFSFYDGSTPAIDHNLYIKGHTVYEANYQAGLQILDSKNVAAGTLTELAYFDIYPSGNSANYNGAWSNYPYFDSDIVLVSGIEQGLFVLQPTLAATAADFTLQPGEVVVDACGNSSDVTFTLDSVYGYNNNVTLSVAGIPANASSGFSPNPVAPDSTTTLTITDSGAAQGDYLLTVTGTGGSLIHQEYLRLKVAGTVGAFSLSSPADGSSGVAILPALAWTTASDADNYLVEIATDASFNTVVYSATVATTNHTVGSALDNSTGYYWRVTARNACGDLRTSSRSFTTVAAPVCTTPTDIPWVSLSSNNGSTNPNGGTPIDVSFDATGLSSGSYSGTLCINSNDPVTPLVTIPLTLTVSGCAAPPAPTTVTISRTGPTDLQLNWLDTGDNAYEVWTIMNKPYFMPGEAGSIMTPVTGTTWTHAGAGTSGNNYYYMVANSCGIAGEGGPVPRVAKFEFAVVPGSP